MNIRTCEGLLVSNNSSPQKNYNENVNFSQGKGSMSCIGFILVLFLDIVSSPPAENVSTRDNEMKSRLGFYMDKIDVTVSATARLSWNLP